MTTEIHKGTAPEVRRWPSACSALRVLAVLLAAVALVAGCAAPPLPAERTEVEALASAIGRLGPGVHADEAAEAAEVAFAETHRLAVDYGITDPPLIHNAKVNAGLRPRGLCWHWADDLEARLAQEGFVTLELHRAIANADNPFRIDHSTVIVSARGGSLFDGIVLDPWRKGGRLHWTPTRADAQYDWEPRASVWAERRRSTQH